MLEEFCLELPDTYEISNVKNAPLPNQYPIWIEQTNNALTVVKKTA